ncbi:MAG: 30S ribosomal protein S1 [Bryobacteraceae bacterium]
MPNSSLNSEQEIANQANEASFGDILSAFEQSHQPEGDAREGTVVAISGDTVFVDIGLKMEGSLPLAEFGGETPAAGDKLQASIKGRSGDGYYLLSRIKVQRPKDWSSLEKAFEEKSAIGGIVAAVVKGGLSVDVGVRAFMPASRSGARDVADMEKLVGQEISCRIIKLDVASEDVVVDRRAVLEEEEARAREQLFTTLKRDTVVRGTVRSLTDYGAFIDIGGLDGLLHVTDMSYGRVNKPSDLLSVGDSVEVQILKVDPARRRVSLGMKQLLPDPWTVAGEKYHQGDRVSGKVARVTDFGAFVELEAGLEGLIHLSEMSWSKKVRKPSDVVKPGDQVEAVVLGVNAIEKRLSLGLKQTLGDPWESAAARFPAGSIVEGPISSLTKFGAFVELGDGLEGMIHIGDMSAEKRLNHPKDMLKEGEAVRAQVLDVDTEKRRIRLGLKQLQPTSMDEYIAEHREGDVVTGRVADVSGGRMKIELGEGIQAVCRPADGKPGEEAVQESKPDLSALSSMLAARWKGGTPTPYMGSGRKEPARAGQVRSFRIVHLDPNQKKIELELAS